MKLILRNHQEEYAAREMITSYLPKIKIEVTSSPEDSGDYVISTLHTEGENYTYESTVSIDGKEYSASVTEKEYSKTYIF